MSLQTIVQQAMDDAWEVFGDPAVDGSATETVSLLNRGDPSASPKEVTAHFVALTLQEQLVYEVGTERMLVRLTDLDGYRITGATVIVRDGVQYAVERERVERGGALADVLVRRRG